MDFTEIEVYFRETPGVKSERSNPEWLVHLRGPEQDDALAELRAILARGLQVALSGQVDPERLDDLVQVSVQDALLKILANLDSFEGRSRFTTWAYKIAIRVACSELRRQRWKDESLEDLLPEEHSTDYTHGVRTDPAPDPERATTRAASCCHPQPDSLRL